MNKQTNKRSYGKMDVDKSLLFIDAVRERIVLWKKNHRQYKHMAVRNAAWAEIAAKENMSILEAKNLWKKLLGCYRSNKAKLRNSLKSGAAHDDVYVPTWFGFYAMTFLDEATEDAGNVDTSVMTKENTLFLISLVKSYGCLWNQRDPGYTNESDKQNAWINISKMMGYPVKEVRDKWNTMRSCFYMFRSKCLGNVIKRKWFAYEALRFLDGKPLDKPPGDVQSNDTLKLGWNDERKLHFISLVKRKECLWNQTCPNYKDALSKQNAWKAISEAMDCSEDDLKWKWASLRASFRMYHSNVDTGSEIERSANYVAAKKWYAYEALRFLANQPDDDDEPLDPALLIDEDIASTPEHIEKSLRLIRLVQAHPALWSEPDEPNKNFATKRTQWQAVASEMGEPVARVAQSWKNLLQSYRRILNSLKDREYPQFTKKRPWYAFEPMQFLQEATEQVKTVQSLPKDDSIKEEVTDSEIVTLVNIRDNRVVCKSINELAAKPPETSLSTCPKPQTQVGNALRIDRRSQPWIKTPVRVKRPYPMPVEDPLQIKQTAQTQLVQVGAPFQNVQRRSLGGRPTLNPASVRSFVNLIEQELSEISSDYATMAQVDIYKIIGEYKLKDVRRGSGQTPPSDASKSTKTKVVKQAAAKGDELAPVKIEPSYSVRNNDMLAVALECEEDTS